VSEFRLSFSRLEAVLSAYFRIDPDRGGTFRARIKQLQRLNFPSGVNVGRGVKFEYELSHALKLVVALEIMALGLPAKFVSELVEESWRRFAIGFQLSPFGWNDPVDASQIYARLNIDLLGDTHDNTDCVEIYDLESLNYKIIGAVSSALIINMTVILKRFDEVLDLIRLRRSIVGYIARKWDTGVHLLSDEVPWDNLWLNVSPDRLAHFRGPPAD
jgi:hypothetical protein